MVNRVKVHQTFKSEPSFGKAESNHFNLLTERRLNNIEPQHPAMYQQPFPIVGTSETTMDSQPIYQERDCSNVLLHSSPGGNFNSVKMSPGFMDTDVQFNYPDYPPTVPHNQNKVEVPSYQYAPTPTAVGNVPKMERQYSINTVMEVIDSHKINENSSFFAASHSNFQNPEHTSSLSQPININRQPVENFEYCEFSEANEMIFSTPAKHAYQNGQVPPASDVRERNQYGCSPAYSNVSYSPGGIPFTRYQDGSAVPTSPGYSNIPSTVPLGTSNNSTNGFPFQATEDLLSPSQAASSPFNWDLSQMPVASPTSAHTVNSTYNDNVFTFEPPKNQFQPSQSCSNISYSGQTVVMQGNETRVVKGFDQNHSMVFPQQSRSSVGSISSLATIELEEIDPSTFNEELGRDQSNLTEQERADQRRIRNNLACRASRQRRKRRKEEKEGLAEFLADQNKELKEQIRKLEMERNSLTEDVRRHMSQP